jgi:PadR family transcriptional regulator PadR
LTEDFKSEIVQRIVRNLLNIQILKLTKVQPTWGYKIKQMIEMDFGVKVRHGVLYPLLNNMENEGFLVSRKESKGGRIRKTYEITEKGLKLLNAYNEVLREQLRK